MSDEARQTLMMMLYEPERDGYESGSDGDFPVEERAIEKIESLQRTVAELERENAELRTKWVVICDVCGTKHRVNPAESLSHVPAND